MKRGACGQNAHFKVEWGSWTKYARGDLEMIYFDTSTNSYQARFGADLPEGFERARAYDSVAELNGQITMILKFNNFVLYKPSKPDSNTPN